MQLSNVVPLTCTFMEKSLLGSVVFFTAQARNFCSPCSLCLYATNTHCSPSNIQVPVLLAYRLPQTHPRRSISTTGLTVLLSIIASRSFPAVSASPTALEKVQRILSEKSPKPEHTPGFRSDSRRTHARISSANSSPFSRRFAVEERR